MRVFQFMNQLPTGYLIAFLDWREVFVNENQTEDKDDEQDGTGNEEGCSIAGCLGDNPTQQRA